MSDQVHKTFLACDGLNRTGQEAPVSREANVLLSNKGDAIHRISLLSESQLDALFSYLSSGGSNSTASSNFSN